MNRIDAPFHVANLFSDGNPSLNQEATFVNSKWGNAIQEELCHLVESAGLTIAQEDVDWTQVRQAIDILIDRGGAQVKTAIANNVLNQDISGLDFKSDDFQMVEVSFEIRRSTTLASYREFGSMLILWDFVAEEWVIDSINLKKGLDETGVTYALVEYQDGDEVDRFKIQYSSDDMAGADHFGEFTVLKKQVSLKA